MHQYKRVLFSVSTGIGMLLAGVAGIAFAQSSGTTEYSVEQYRTALDRYCVSCHNETLKTANLMLDRADVQDLSQAPQIWEKVITKLSLRSMPPVGMPRPDESFYESFSSHLKTELNRLAEINPNPGREVTAHRLNRTEYTNAVRDLMGVEIDGAAMLPADNSGGFDNLGDLLSVSQLLLEKYMSAARMVTGLAIGDPNTQLDSQAYTVDPKLLQDKRMDENLPFGSRGGIAVKHRFPLDGEYVIKVRLQKHGGGPIIGIAKPSRLDFRVDGKRVKLLTVGGDNVGLGLGREASDTVPPDAEQSMYERNADKALEVRFPMTAGTHLVQVAFLKENFAWEGVVVPPPNYESFNKARVRDTYARSWYDPTMADITIDGPYNAKGVGETASRQAIFVCYPGTRAEEEPCARQILSLQARRAYRRPVNDADITPYLGLYRQARQQQGSFETGIRKALEGLLMSSEFLFRIEADPAGIKPDTNYALDDLALASRLSFFLWSSIPDDELLSVAEQGRLHEPAVLEKQVRRMMADKRSESLVGNFAEQWLLLRNLPAAEKSARAFPDFDEELRQAFYNEVTMFVGNIFHGDRSILDLFRADYSFLNERLAKHYGVEGVYGNRFRRVNMPEEQQGLLARAGILSITSYPNRNSTVLRGKWVLDNLLASPPPEPPTIVPALENIKPPPGETLTLRERMEIHPANPVCAVCHNQMDPIGFGLENYDAIGQWRTEDEGKPINASGTLPSGVKFEGPAELQEALLSEPEIFVSAFTQKLLIYALGRPLEYYDMPAVRVIVDKASDKDYQFSSIVLGIINSRQFQMRRSGS
jgi:hypothetical protein